MPTDHSPTRLSRLLLLLALLFVLSFSLGRLVYTGTLQLPVAHDLFFETPNLGTIQAIQTHKPLYSPKVYSQPPFLITLYNPLYHLLVASLPQHPHNLFLTGRIVSLVILLVLLIALAFVGRTKRSWRFWLAFLFALSWLLLIHQSTRYAFYLRHELLGVLLSVCTIILLEKTTRHPVQLFQLVFLGFLAFFTKQPYLLASGVCFLYLLRHKKAWLTFCAFGLLVYGLFGVYAASVWGQGYWYSVFGFLSTNKLSSTQFALVWGPMLRQPAFCLLLLATVLTLLDAWRQGGLRTFTDSPYPLYVCTIVVTLLITSAKEGSDDNYFLEIVPACLCWLLYWFQQERPPAQHQKLLLAGALALCLVSAYEIHWSNPAQYSFAPPQKTKFLRKVYRAVDRELRMVRRTSAPFLCITNHTVSFRQQKPGVLNDTNAYWMMWARGLLDAQPLLDAIARKEFSLIIIQPVRRKPYLTMFLPIKTLAGNKVHRQVLHTLQRHYRLRYAGILHYFVPRPSPSTRRSATPRPTSQAAQPTRTVPIRGR